MSRRSLGYLSSCGRCCLARRRRSKPVFRTRWTVRLLSSRDRPYACGSRSSGRVRAVGALEGTDWVYSSFLLVGNVLDFEFLSSH